MIQTAEYLFKLKVKEEFFKIEPLEDEEEETSPIYGQYPLTVEISFIDGQPIENLQTVNLSPGSTINIESGYKTIEDIATIDGTKNFQL